MSVDPEPLPEDHPLWHMENISSHPTLPDVRLWFFQRYGRSYRPLVVPESETVSGRKRTGESGQF